MSNKREPIDGKGIKIDVFLVGKGMKNGVFLAGKGINGALRFA